MQYLVLLVPLAAVALIAYAVYQSRKMFLDAKDKVADAVKDEAGKVAKAASDVKKDLE